MVTNIYQTFYQTICALLLTLPTINTFFTIKIVKYLQCKAGRERLTSLSPEREMTESECRRNFGLKQEAHLRRTRHRPRVNWEELRTGLTGENIIVGAIRKILLQLI